MNFTPSEIRTLVHIATKQTGTPVHDEDLEQEVAVRAIEAFRRLNQVAHPRALLMKIVQDTVRDHWRRRRQATFAAFIPALDDLDQRFIAQEPSFEFDLDSRRQIDLLRRGLRRLPAARRELLELFYIQSNSIPQIAKTCGRSVSAVKMDLLRSRQSLARIVCSLANKKSR